ncbi:MAG: DUF3488 and transglutaminase-like domain-containing protein [Pseudomonadota bacterium]
MTQTLSLKLFLGAASVLHLPHLDANLSTVLVFCAFAALVIPRFAKGLRLKVSTFAIGAIAALVVLSQVDWFNGAAILTLLGAAGWLKLAEIRGRRDELLVWTVAFWMLGMAMLWLPPGAAILIMPLGLALGVWCLSQLMPARPGWRAIVRSLAAALPATVLLFTFTPRITGDLGALSFALGIPLIIETEAEKKRDPMLDSFAMGDLAERASEPDLRVLSASFYDGSGNFYDGVPPLGDLYWRGPVLWTFEDGKWAGRKDWGNRTARMKGKITHKTLDRELRETGLISVYDVKLFPHRGYWLYALDFPAAVPASSFITKDYQLQNLNPVRELLSYPMMSYLDYRAGPELGAETRAMALQLPEGENPKTRALGQDLLARHTDPIEIAKAGLTHFDQGFLYDRSVGGINEPDPVDVFLFSRRTGYAGHFATAYALMMRAAGVPSRLVVGYRGGIHLGLTNRVFVMEEHTHSWAEIWLDAYGWVRMDPAARVSRQDPQEADGWGLGGQIGGEEQPEEDRTEDPATAPEFDTADPGTLSTAPRPSAATTPDVRPWWQNWITGFDANRQLGLLDMASLSGTWWSLLALGAGLATVLATAWMLTWRLLRWMAERRKPFEERCELALCRRLARSHRTRHHGEALTAYLQACGLEQRKPEFRALVSELRAALFAGRRLDRDWLHRLRACR